MKDNQSQNLATESAENLALETDGQSGLVGRELDAAIACVVMGYSASADYYRWHDTRGHPHVRLANSFRPSIDIASAMEVIEKLIADGARPVMNYFGDNAAGTHWNVTIYRIAGNPAQSTSASGTTLPETICRAVLAALQITKSSEASHSTELSQDSPASRDQG